MYCTHLKNKTVTTRKEHRCYGCSHKFPEGSKMHYSVSVSDEAGFTTSYWCQTCSKKLDQINWNDFEDGIGPGELKDYELQY